MYRLGQRVKAGTRTRAHGRPLPGPSMLFPPHPMKLPHPASRLPSFILSLCLRQMFSRQFYVNFFKLKKTRTPMNASPYIKGIIILLAFVLCSFYCLPSAAPAKTKRGDAPHCQEECLTHHTDRMRQLSEEYLNTGNKMKYQDGVEEEVLNYSRCLTECRELLPVK